MQNNNHFISSFILSMQLIAPDILDQKSMKTYLIKLENKFDQNTLRENEIKKFHSLFQYNIYLYCI